MTGKEEIKKRNISYFLNNQDEALDPKHYKLFSDVLHKLPANVLDRLFQLEPQVIIMEKGDFGQSFPIKKMRIISRKATKIKEDKIFEGQTWLIILNEELIDKCFRSEKHSVIAEELAHTYAGHGAELDDDDDMLHFAGDYRSDLRTEREAARLLKQWGFEYLNTDDIKKILSRKS